MAYLLNSNTVINDNRIFFPVNSAEKVSNLTISSNTITIDLDTATVFNVTVNSNIDTITVANSQAVGLTSSFVLITEGDGSTYTITWPASFKWPDNTAPTYTSTSSKKDVYTFFTVDNGTSWQSFIAGQNL